MVIMKKLINQKRYHYTDCGLDYIYLANGFDIIKHPELGSCVAIHDVDGLHRIIMQLIINKIPHIRGQEIRFIRSFLKLSQTQMGLLVKKGIRTIQRWEKEEKNNDIPESLDSFLRLFLSAYLDKDGLTHQVCEILKNVREEQPKKMLPKIKSRYELSDTSNGWKMSA